MNGRRYREMVAGLSGMVHQLHPNDEVCLTAFATSIKTWTPWTQDWSRFEREAQRLGTAMLGNTTRLFDAVSDAIHTLNRAKNRRRAILVLSDGVDTSLAPPDTIVWSAAPDTTLAAYSDKAAELRVTDALLHQEAVVFSVSIALGDAKRESPGLQTLTRLSVPTSGSVEVGGKVGDVAPALSRILDVLRSQYLIAFEPVKPMDGKYRSLQVEVANPRLHARTRTGYIAERRRR